MEREAGQREIRERERIEKKRAERMAGTIDGDFVAGDSVSFCSEVSGVEVFCFAQGSVRLTAAGLYCSIRRTRNHTGQRIEQETKSGQPNQAWDEVER
jgi:hypothetical protein